MSRRSGTYFAGASRRMTVFRVWAPDARFVDLVLQDGRRRLAMQGNDRGWWQLDVPEAGPGTTYGFSIDGGLARPDPRSPWQPEGIDGPSAVVDHRGFCWSDQRWRGAPLAGAVIYE